MYLVNSQEMKQYDKNTIEYYGVPSAVLMERAALAVFQEIRTRFSDTSNRILVVCGAGNNGGDGFAIARLLYLAGYAVAVHIPMEPAKMTPETKQQYYTIQKYKIQEVSELTEINDNYHIIVDALFGIGLCREISGQLLELTCHLNRLSAYKIAVDISSGVDTDTGKVLGIAFLADLTVTFGFAKIGQMLYPGAEFTGELVVADIGIDTHSILDERPFGRYMNHDSAAKLLPKRSAYSNKGSYGKVLVIAGSPKMAGAAYFAAKAAYYTGCGLVRIFTAKENREILLNKIPEAILTTYETDAENTISMMADLDTCMNWADAILTGPGLGDSYAAKMLVAKVLQYPDKKIVFDADALNILSYNMELLREAKCSTIVTPHLGEMSRLTGFSVKEIQDNLLQTALDFSEKYNSLCVLKDARTVIGTANGEFYINPTGNHGMATGGSGDVLAGMLTGFLAQKVDETKTAALSCYLHGLAGDFAAKEKGAYSMLASDILENIPAAILAVS